MNRNVLDYALENNLVLTAVDMLFSRWSIIMIRASWKFSVGLLLENAVSYKKKKKRKLNIGMRILFSKF